MDRRVNFGVVVFPGTNCDSDVFYALTEIMEQRARYVWHKDIDIDDLDCVVLPGGFSFGDYLRAGAIAAISPVMDAVKKFAKRGGLVIGICNGFQILTEARLLPGAFLQNNCLEFRCIWENLYMRTENTSTYFSNELARGQVVRMPIAHGEGNFYCDKATLSKMKKNGQIVFRYCDKDGKVTRSANPNGSVSNIAAITNEGKNVFGIMPHPERASEDMPGGTDGLFIWNSILAYLRASSRPNRP